MRTSFVTDLVHLALSNDRRVVDDRTAIKDFWLESAVEVEESRRGREEGGEEKQITWATTAQQQQAATRRLVSQSVN